MYMYIYIYTHLLFTHSNLYTIIYHNIIICCMLFPSRASMYARTYACALVNCVEARNTCTVAVMHGMYVRSVVQP